MHHFLVIDAHHQAIIISPNSVISYDAEDALDEKAVRSLLLSHGVDELIIAYEVRVYASRCHETNYNTPDHHHHLRDPALMAKRARRKEEKKKRKADRSAPANADARRRGCLLWPRHPSNTM
jgi:hypothetical protein